MTKGFVNQFLEFGVGDGVGVHSYVGVPIGVPPGVGVDGFTVPGVGVSVYPKGVSMGG